jgi:CubicO group peptidase (beta-lactamase class C family)
MLPRLLLILTLAGASFAQDIASRLDQAVLPFVSNKQLMGSVLVARNGDVLFSKGYGSADLEWDVPNTPNTKFRLGSVTKQFTAASILLLEERGKLRVGDPVKTYMPDAPAAWDKITIYNLLTHTSGIPNFTGFPDYREAGNVGHHARRETGGALPRQAARFPAGREVELQQLGICAAQLLDRKDHRRHLREVCPREHLHAVGHEGFRL